MKRASQFKQLVIRHKHILVAAAIIFVLTILLLWPMATNITSYSDGGDHMFNAWTLARNHHCLLQQGCESYVNGNIFFPNSDSMLFSETQLSAGILTLPFFLINQNPLFATNMWYILSVFFSGFFMYLLARYLSKGNQAISILSGLVFAFAPTKISSLSHLQNLSIFYVPLIILLLLKYRDTGNRKYLAGMGIASALLFLASWYQMVFGLIIILGFIGYVGLANRRRALVLLGVTALAVLVTLPLAREYSRFSESTQASFSISDRIAFSSSIDDYFLPYENTPAGMAYYQLRPFILKNSHNPDNYSYAGVTLYAALVLSLVLAYRSRKKVKEKDSCRLVILLSLLFIAGVIFSLGPVLKIGSTALFQVQDIRVGVPLPYIFVDQFIPQLSFIRAVGRASVISLFALCCLLAILAPRLDTVTPRKKRIILTSLLFVFVALDLLPVKQFITTPFKDIPSHQVNYTVPDVYKLVHDDPNINNIVILRTQTDYPYAGIPIARVEDVMWAGYHNKNIFNGYSGFEPKGYKEMLADFIDLQNDDPAKMKALGLKYVIIDKQLSQDNPNQKTKADALFSNKVFEDQRYILYRI